MRPDYNFDDLNDREILLIVAKDVQRVTKVLDDNGQPGLITRVARLEGADNKTAQKSGGLAAMVAIAVAVAMQKLGLA